MGQVLGVIGGSGLYQMPGLSNVEEIVVDTPWGEPSDALIKGQLGETTLLFLPRHGRGHRIPPSAINYRANVWALKSQGATHVLSVSAVGSLREEIAPGELVVVDQFIDRTQRRAGSFFDELIAAHVSMADPVCPLLAKAVAEAARSTEARVHEGGTYVCIEGPRFSTRAESHMFRSWDCSVVGMTNVPEVFLARELELPYATLALATDYDCWRSHDASVDITDILAILKSNVSRAQETVRALAALLPDAAHSPASRALEFALLTDRDRIPAKVRERFSPLFAKYGW
ncbi:MAG: S-methyl-5'-thioadenosine phosphorylase [Deltaproteobacteria bacterium]|nr:S-methyl-5'-thioadenosine phosphorylase [Deltaproteobacteria bacterium]